MSETRPPEQSSEPRWDPADEPEYLLLPEPQRSSREAMAARPEPTLAAIVDRIEGLEGVVDRVASQVAVARDEIGAFASEIRDGLRSLTAAIGSVRADASQLSNSVDQTRRELGAAVEATRAESASENATLRGELEMRIAGVQAGLEETEASLRQAMRDATGDVGLVLRESAQAVQTSIGEATRVAGEEHAATMDRYAKEFAVALRPLGEGLARVERLASVIEAMSKQRGFQKLVRSERALREEQAAFVKELSETSADVTGRVAALAEQMKQLEEGLERAAQDASSLKQLPVHATERVARAVERLRTELTVVLQDRFSEQVSVSVERLRTELEAGLPVKEALDRLRDLGRTQTDLSHVQKSIDGVVASLREEVRSLRDRIQSWGKPRTAPRLATELDQLGGRLDALETELRNGLAERLAQTVTEKVISGLEDSEAGRSRGLFRRP
ncbi:MAG: hypothetical protein M3135_03065 [Actinomycetota bacterium]|nr:hypothetical protein [Actinomycetota bacterium]